MTTYIALLRGVNVGGAKMVAMSDLRAMGAAIGLTDVATLLQSGNMVFRSATKNAAALEQLLHKETKARLGVETDFHVRTSDELQDAIDRNPFPKEAKDDPGHMILLFLKEAPTPAAVKALQAAIPGRERVKAAGRHAYFVYPDGMGRSKLTPAMVDKHLTRGTARNWNTVQKLAALALTLR